MTDETYSQHYEEFRARVDSYRVAGVAVPNVVWTAILDLGNQISTVRHQVAAMEQADHVLDAKLFGWETGTTPEFAEGGIFGVLSRKLDAVQSASTAEVVAQTKEMKDDLAWIRRIAGVFIGAVVLVVVGVGVAFVAHLLGWNP